MGWYQVTKTIKGIAYLYRQRTWRENGRVQTESVYVGRADSGGRERRSGSNGTRTPNMIGTASSPVTHKVPKQIDNASPARAPTAAKAAKVGRALAEYDHLVSIAQDLYEKANLALNDDYEKAFADYLHSKTAITAHQSEVLGEEIVEWSGGEGGSTAEIYHRDFEDALIAKRGGKTSKPPQPRKIKVTERLPADGDFSGPFWDTPHSPEHLRQQSTLYYREYLKVRARCDAYHALDVSSWQAARSGKARLAELGTQLDWYKGKCRSWFDRDIVFTKSRVVLKENE